MYVCMYVDIRWEEFSKWYLGEEFTQKIPGKGIPTLARVGLLPCFYYCYVRNLTLLHLSFVDTSGGNLGNPYGERRWNCIADAD